MKLICSYEFEKIRRLEHNQAIGKLEMAALFIGDALFDRSYVGQCVWLSNDIMTREIVPHQDGFPKVIHICIELFTDRCFCDIFSSNKLL